MRFRIIVTLSLIALFLGRAAAQPHANNPSSRDTC
jgi:hypothetical protein